MGEAQEKVDRRADGGAQVADPEQLRGQPCRGTVLGRL